MKRIACALLLLASLPGHAANTAMRYLSVAELPYVQAVLSDARVLDLLHGLVSRRRYVLAGIERVDGEDRDGQRAMVKLHLHDPESASTDPEAEMDIVAEAVVHRSGREYEITRARVLPHR